MKSRATKKQIEELFPNSFITQANTLKLSDKDGEEYSNNPVCLNYECRNTNLNYEGQNPDYEIDVYTCDECPTISVQGYETIFTGGNVGIDDDLEGVR
jgi:hypothetical protein|tara:strand:+ start:137 stop:430 length:294 start_codon:yes stop_codon:yes gene_type:complete